MYLLNQPEIAVANEAGGEGAELVELDEDAAQAFPAKEGACDAGKRSVGDFYLLAVEVRGHGLLIYEDVVIFGFEDGAEIEKLFVGHHEIIVTSGFLLMKMVVIGCEAFNLGIGIGGMDELIELRAGGAQKYKPVMQQSLCDDLCGLAIFDFQSFVMITGNINLK